MFKSLGTLATLKSKARLMDERKRHGEALKAWKKVAERGDAEGFYQVGLHYEVGAGVLQNLIEAVAWHKQAAERAFPSAYSRLGSIYLTGRETAARNPATSTMARLFPAGLNVMPDQTEAFHWNLKGAEADEGSSKVLLALQFASGLGTAVDYSAAEHWFREAASQGETAGYFGLGKLYAANQLAEADEARAIAAFRHAAEKDHVQAKVCLAVLLSGVGDAKSMLEAHELLQAAAAQNSIDAMYLLGQANLLGQGTNIDLSLAEMWFRRAAVKGHLRSGVSLAQLLVRRPAPDYVAAAELLAQAAGAGNAVAQFELAKLCQAGLGVRRDHERAVVLFEQAADQGVVAAFENLGGIYADGLSTVVNSESARDWFLKAADIGSSNAMFYVGALAEVGQSEGAATAALYTQAAIKGSAAAALRLGVLYATGDLLDQDYTAAAAWYEKAVALGSLTARWNLAFLHIRGLGLPKDVEKGATLLKMDALAGHRTAALSLVALFSTGQYVESDAEEVRIWRLRAAELGDGRAAADLVLALDPEAPSGDGQTYIDLLIRCAEANDLNAQSTLGRIAYDGKLVPQDMSLSLHWLTKAAEQGDAFAQAWLGDVLTSGEGGSKDRQGAIGWYWRSATAGHVGAALILTDMALKGRPDVLPEQVFDLWRRAADAGSALGQRMAGDFLLRGFGVRQDLSRGVNYLRLASLAGNTAAQSLLAVTLLRYPDQRTFDFEAAELLRSAADADNVEAQYNLGVCYKRGLHIAADRSKAEHWYRRAADAGHPSAELALADLLTEAIPSLDQSVVEIATLYEKAYRRGLPEGAFGLALMHERGLLETSSAMEAIKLYAEAAQKGHAPSRDRLEALAGSRS